MAKLAMLKPRVAQLDTRRVKPVNSENTRISGATRVSAKRRVYARDGGRCCLCHCVVDLSESELDHRVALQFGGDNSDANLWTLCIPCHADKTAREAATRDAGDLPDVVVM
ncbi:HNH endonuclease [Hafnia alvei]|uniref:HNH endonuclease n=1 Tax=Hafnia alvei TaxID=569 RepID=UPI000B62C821|nr:HNH endonuclease signature motif containing protein [Hafnia alvei]MBI0275671.1 HNH endonuclease [Hafnia alvei]PNK98343.1 HNH endonuclease [Hafnia alvei]